MSTRLVQIPMYGNSTEFSTLSLYTFLKASYLMRVRRSEGYISPSPTFHTELWTEFSTFLIFNPRILWLTHLLHSSDVSVTVIFSVPGNKWCRYLPLFLQVPQTSDKKNTIFLSWSSSCPHTPCSPPSIWSRPLGSFSASTHHCTSVFCSWMWSLSSNWPSRKIFHPSQYFVAIARGYPIFDISQLVDS